MSVQVATGELLLDKLLENSNIKAAILVDDRGYVIEKRGSAACFKLDNPRDSGAHVAAPPARKPTENLYLVEAGAEFLVVVFDDRMNFERIKDYVDGTLGELGMAPNREG